MADILVRLKIQDLIIFLFLIIGISQMHRRHRFVDLADRYDFGSDLIEIPYDRWPFSFRKVNDSYEIKLEYSVSNEDTFRWLLPESDVLEFGRADVFLTQKDLEGIRDGRWIRPIRNRVFQAYSQNIDLNKTIHHLLYKKPIPEKPINGDTFRYIAIPQKVCHPDKASTNNFDVIVIVKTSLSNFERREAFREIYGSFVNENINYPKRLKIALVFSLGLPRTQEDNKFERAGEIFELTDSGGEYLNPLFLDVTSKRLEGELKLYNDLIVGNYEDTYFNLTIKSHYSYTWVSTFCRSYRPVVLFIDDDVPFSPESLEKTLISMPDFHINNLFHGKIEDNSWAYRPGTLVLDQRMIVSRSEVPWPVYSPYLQGIYIVAGFKQVELLALGMAFTKHFPIEDAWVGLVARRMNVTPRNIHHFMRRSHMILRDVKGFGPTDKKVYVH